MNLVNILGYMGALVHKNLHRTRSWNRVRIPKKIYSFDLNLMTELPIARFIAETENQTGEYTKVSSHPVFFFITMDIKDNLSRLLEELTLTLQIKPIVNFFFDYS